MRIETIPSADGPKKGFIDATRVSLLNCVIVAVASLTILQKGPGTRGQSCYLHRAEPC